MISPEEAEAAFARTEAARLGQDVPVVRIPDDAEPVVVPVTEPATGIVLERVLRKDPASGAVGVGPDGVPLWPPQPELPELEAPVQEYRDVPADAVYWSDAARATAEGWKPPLPDIDEVIRQREAFRMAWKRACASRNPHHGPVREAVQRAAQLDSPDPTAPVYDAIVRCAMDLYVTQAQGQGSELAGLSYEIEARWWAVLWRHRRAIIRSLMGRDSEACNRLRQMAETMERYLDVPKPDPLAYQLVAW